MRDDKALFVPYEEGSQIIGDLRDLRDLRALLTHIHGSGLVLADSGRLRPIGQESAAQKDWAPSALGGEMLMCW